MKSDREQELEWAVSLSGKIKKTDLLPALQYMVSYEDKDGALSQLLHGSLRYLGKVYQGTSSLTHIAKKIRSTQSSSNRVTGTDRIDSIYQHLCKTTPKKLSKLAKEIDGGERTILTLYLRYSKNNTFPLPKLDVKALKDLLGSTGKKLKETPILRILINIFITYYSDFCDKTRKWIAENCKKYLVVIKPCPASMKSWTACAALLLSVNSAEAFARNFQESAETNFTLYASQRGVQQHTKLYTSIRLEVLCQKIKAVPMGAHAKVFDEITKQKNDAIDDIYCVGAKALEIIIDRCVEENSSSIPDKWADLIVDLGCHPNMQIANGAEHVRFWWWASQHELDIAKQAFVKRDLEVVFEYLRKAAQKGQMGGHMVAPRVDFFKSLLRNGLILDSRLFVGVNVHHELHEKLKHDQFWDLHAAGDSDLCIMALKLADGVSLTTGTKSFPMRFFPTPSKSFDLIWNDFSPTRKSPVFSRHHFMIDEFSSSGRLCIRKTHSGDWKWSVLNQVLPDSFLGRVDWTHHNL